MYATLDVEIKKTKEKEREAEEQAKKEYEAFLVSAEAEINEKALEAAKKREADYQENVSCFEQANTPYQYLY